MNEEKTVWVVTEGEYSDYGIVAMFSTEEDAETCSSLLGEDTRIEEWTMDAYVVDFREGRRPWYVVISRDGTVANAAVTTALPGPDEFFPTFLPPEDRKLTAHFFARSEEHAIKIANERRAIHIANGTWGVNPKSEEEDER